MKQLQMLSESLKSIWTEFCQESLRIFTVDIREISCRDMRAAYLLMSEERRKKCDSLKKEDDKKRCIAADYLLRTALEYVTGQSSESFQFELTEKGKPYCVNFDCYFSISHAGDYVAVAVDLTRQVGVDIEKIRPIRAAVMRMFCNICETEFIKGTDVNDGEILTDTVALERFYKIWTFKEAAVKLTGEGITDNLREIIYDENKCFCKVFDGYCLSALSDYGIRNKI